MGSQRFESRSLHIEVLHNAALSVGGVCRCEAVNDSIITQYRCATDAGLPKGWRPLEPIADVRPYDDDDDDNKNVSFLFRSRIKMVSHTMCYPPSISLGIRSVLMYT